MHSQIPQSIFKFGVYKRRVSVFINNHCRQISHLWSECDLFLILQV